MRLTEQEKPQFSQPDSDTEVINTPEMVKARNTLETLLQTGKLIISPELYPSSGKPILLNKDQLQQLPVIGSDVPILVVAPNNIEIQLHESSASEKVIIHLPQGKGDEDPCYVLDMRKYGIYPRETVLKNCETNYGSYGCCITATGEYVSASVTYNILQDGFVSAIVLFAGCDAAVSGHLNSKLAALEIPSNF